MMEEHLSPINHDDEEFVLLDLDAVSKEVRIPPHAPYVLSGLDTLNPIMVIDDKLKLIGEYEETIGTCLVFSEDAVAPAVHLETGPSEKNLFNGKGIIDPNQPPKQLKSVARLHKILKFQLMSEIEDKDETEKPNINQGETRKHNNQDDTETHTITDLQ